MKYLYNVLVYLAAPIVFATQLWRGVKDPAHWARMRERFGFTARFDRSPLWIHAVSVGEVQAAVPLIRRLLDEFADSPLLVTTGTATGAARVREAFGDQVRHSYLPYDLPGAVTRFVARVRPRAALVMETELWPNLFRACIARDVPLVLVSARISPRTASRYHRLKSLFHDTLPRVWIAAQTASDAERFQRLGANAERICITGNLKFDLEISAEHKAAGRAWRASQAAQRCIWIAGSTREGEEPQVLEAHRQILAQRPDALLILAPRHPQRFSQVAEWLKNRGVAFVTRSGKLPLTAQHSVLLLDVLGELTQFYAASDLAFVGGSLVPIGGHNLLEPAAFGLPVVTGPSTFNAQEIAQRFFASGAAICVHSADELAKIALRLLQSADEREAMGAKALQLIDANRGALERTMRWVRPVLA